MQYDNTFFTFYFCNSKQYRNIPEKSMNALYFITDKQQLHQGENPIGNGVILYDKGTRPANGLNNVLYIEKQSLTGWIFDDNGWNLVMPPCVHVITYEGVDVYAGEDAVKKYIDLHVPSKIKSKSCGNLIYDNYSKMLVYSYNGATRVIDINNFIDDITFDNSTRMLSFFNRGKQIGTSIKVVDTHIIAGEYDNNVKAILFHMSDGTIIRIMTGALLRLYDSLATNTTTPAIQNYEDGNNIISTNVKISSKHGNLLRENKDGVYCTQPWIADVGPGEWYKNIGSYNNEILVAGHNQIINESQSHITNKIVLDRYNDLDIASEFSLPDTIKSLMNYIESMYITKDTLIDGHVTEKELVDLRFPVYRSSIQTNIIQPTK